MQTVNGASNIGGFRVFTTNGGPHSPEVMADMSMHQLFTNDSNPVRCAEIRQYLVDMYRHIQRSARILFETSGDDDLLRLAITDILTRDINTAMNIERQYKRESN